ncbi:alpha-amylase family glycosyl hydrolase [Salinicoccus sp. HZC-1]|uniref:alpha-amylase family glycosyl hydrolase n=1 Tax=Salinicoccus sp. HZC-1 TaxID=3385497 RepID=UPI00398B252E
MHKLIKYIAVLLILGGVFHHEASAQEKVHDRIYTIVVDRFLDADTSNNISVTENENEPLPFGGDFQGIEDNLEYIQDMGFDTLMLSPVFEKADEDYLGYDVKSYEEIAEAYGGAEEFRNLVDAAHALGMKVVVDMPVTATDQYETLDNPELNELQQQYYSGLEDVEFIDLSVPENQDAYQEMAQSFVDEYGIDGLSMNVVQDGLNAEDFMPGGVKTYGIIGSESVTAEGFDHESRESTRQAIAEAFSTTGKAIPPYPEDGELLLADHWFTERFTFHATEANMFPGTRVQQLTTYLYGYPGPISFQYGTEVALNGESIPQVHRQMDLWTDQEVVDYIKDINTVFTEHQQLLSGEVEELKSDEDGHYIVRYNTSAVDFILNINDTAKTRDFKIPQEADDEGKMLSGMLIGDSIKVAEGEDSYNAILDREETELYAVIEETGLNNGYVYAALIIFGGFGIFIWIVARKRKSKEEM